MSSNGLNRPYDHVARSDVPSSVPGPPGEKPLPVRRREDQSNRATVLVVDDEPVNVTLARRWMDKAGYQVLSAYSGQEALDIVRHEHVDLILLDVMMPEMDGYAVYESLLEDPLLADVLVVFVTARTDPEDRVRGLRMGAADYLTKPYYGDELLARVATALRAKDQRDILAQRARQLEEQSVRDPLTGLYNRRLLDERLSQEVSRAERYGLVVSCLMVDIDYFKQVNDTFGHDQGDFLIKQMAELVQASSRSSDFVARYGGEEFAVILPQTGVREAFEIAERIRRRANEARINALGMEHTISVSIGVASFPGGAAVDAPGLMREADQALLRAKAAGKNCTMMANPIMQPKDSPVPGKQSEPGKLLIVEDEPNNQALLQKVLTRMGYAWDCVQDGSEAVEQVKHHAYAAVLMDLSLPRLDGWQATQQIRSAGFQMPIIATSAHAMAADKERALAAGCTDYITKPYDLGELRRTLDRYAPLPKTPEAK